MSVLFAALSGAIAALPVEPPQEAFAVIVASNESLDDTLPDLSYADDDGARYHELLSLFATHVEVMSVLDSSTQRLHPRTAAVARVPTKRAVLDALGRTFERITEANRRGVRTAFYFVYVGHGSIDADGEGTMHLFDDRFSRSDLFQEVIARSPATVNHVVIDACNAYLLVAKRGASDDAAVSRAVERFLDREDLSRYPNTGVLLSTSKATEVHEWGRFSAGIFSHEIRSALAGGADVDEDGKVTYEEVRAFLSAANGRIADPAVRLEPFVAPPRVRIAEPLFDRSRVSAAPAVFVPRTMAGRYFLEDARGVRFADFHMGADDAVTMTLVPQPVYFLKSEQSERMIPLDAVAMVDASTLEQRPLDFVGRGAEELSFRRDLFGIPFGRAFFEGFRANPPPQPATLAAVAEPPFFTTSRVVALGLVGGAVAAGITGAIFGAKSSDAAEDFRTFVGSADEAAALAASSRRDARAANALYAIGGGLVVSAVVTYLLSFP